MERTLSFEAFQYYEAKHFNLGRTELLQHHLDHLLGSSAIVTKRFCVL